MYNQRKLAKCILYLFFRHADLNANFYVSKDNSVKGFLNYILRLSLLYNYHYRNYLNTRDENCLDNVFTNKVFNLVIRPSYKDPLLSHDNI